MPNFFGDLTRKLIGASTPKRIPDVEAAREIGETAVGATRAIAAPFIQKGLQEKLGNEYALTAYRLDLAESVGSGAQRKLVRDYRGFLEKSERKGLTDSEIKGFKDVRKKLVSPYYLPSKSELEGIAIQRGKPTPGLKGLLAEKFKRLHEQNASVEDFINVFNETVSRQMPNVDVNDKTFMIGFLKNMNNSMAEDSRIAGMGSGLVDSYTQQAMGLDKRDVERVFDRVKKQYVQDIKTTKDPLAKRLKTIKYLAYASQIKIGEKFGESVVGRAIGDEVWARSFGANGMLVKDRRGRLVVDPRNWSTPQATQRVREGSARFAETILKNNIENYDKFRNKLALDLWTDIERAESGRDTVGKRLLGWVKRGGPVGTVRDLWGKLITKSVPATYNMQSFIANELKRDDMKQYFSRVPEARKMADELMRISQGGF